MAAISLGVAPGRAADTDSARAAEGTRSERPLATLIAEETRANQGLQTLRARQADGGTVDAEALAAAHEAAAAARAATNRARFQAAARIHQTDPDARALRRALAAAATPEERRTILIRHQAVEQALDDEAAR